jgi:hypothetical protein
MIFLPKLKHGTPEQLLQMAAAGKMHPKTKLAQIIQEIFTAEQEYELLKDDRKKYEEEIRKEQNAMLEWKRKNIPAYDVSYDDESKRW